MGKYRNSLARYRREYYRLYRNSQGYYKKEARRTSLRESEEKYRSIFENAVEGIFQVSADGHFISVNPAMARIYGDASPEEMIARITDVGQLYVDHQERRRYQDLIEKHGMVNNFESQFYRKDGAIIWLSINARAVKDEAGKTLYYEGTVEDITLRKNAEQTADGIGRTVPNGNRIL